MTEAWDKQKRELESYNVFYSAIKGVGPQQSLYDLGYRVVGNFLIVPDNRNDAECHSDIVLYNNETLMLVEIKSGNSVRKRHERQMNTAGEISIEAAREFLQDTDLDDPILDPSELEYVQPVIVYYQSTIDSCHQSSGCRSRLDQMGEQGCVVSQAKNGHLKMVNGTVHTGSLETVLQEGIELPKFPDTSVYLTDNADREILSYSICIDLVRPQFNTERTISVEIDDIYERYRGRQIERRHIIDALDFLAKIGICRKRSDREYIFSRDNISKIMSVGEYLEGKLVTEWLEEEVDSQTSLSEFAPTSSEQGIDAED